MALMAAVTGLITSAGGIPATAGLRPIIVLNFLASLEVPVELSCSSAHSLISAGAAASKISSLQTYRQYCRFSSLQFTIDST
jgi:hypothetical protein